MTQENALERHLTGEKSGTLAEDVSSTNSEKGKAHDDFEKGKTEEDLVNQTVCSTTK